MELRLRVLAPSAGPELHRVVVQAGSGTDLGDLLGPLTQVLGQTHPRVVDALLDGPWHVDGAPVHADSALGHPPLITGAVLTTGVEAQALAIACGSAGSTSARTVVELRVSEGPAAGVCRPLPLGDVLVGRGPQCHVQVDDPTLSRTQLRLAVTADRVFVTDLGGPNTTTLDDGPLVPGEPTVVPAGSRLQVGDTVLTLAVAEPGPRSPTPDGQGRLVVTPVLRPRPPIDRSPVPVPAAPDATRASRPPWAALLVPLMMCGVAAWILHSTVLLVLGLVSPAAIFVGWLVDRRHGRRQGAFTRHRHARAIAAADVVVRDRVAAELAARRETHPDLATVWAAAHHRAPGLWCQPAAEPRATEVRLGRADLPALFVTRPVDDAGAQHGSDQHPVLPDAPLVLDLIRPTVLVGPATTTRALAGALAAQLATWCAPSTLQLVVHASGARAAAGWELLEELPHATRAAAGGTTPALRLVLVDQLDRLGSWPAEPDHTGQPRTLLLGVARDLAGVPPGVDQLVLLDDEGGAELVRRGTHGTVRLLFRPDLPAPGWLDGVLRALEPLTLADTATERGGLPTSLTLDEIEPLAVADAWQLRVAWAEQRSGLSTTVGVGADGTPVSLDLTADGPHALVAGTTGAGKSELLRTLVSGLALYHGPHDLSFVLVDYKGGSAFAECAQLPHCQGLVTDLDPALAERALASLTAELRRRERLLAAVGAEDLAAYRRTGQQSVNPLPRLLVVVDEFRMLATDLPEFVPGLLKIATVGRSLGVHLVLATQRPAGVVTPDIKANVSARIALRVADVPDSVDVLDVPDAARLPNRAPGRAYFRRGVERPQPFQVAQVSAPAAARRPPVLVRPLDPVSPALAAPSGRGVRPGIDAEPSSGHPTLLSQVVATAQEAARDLPLPPPAWLPPLADLVQWPDLGRRALAEPPPDPGFALLLGLGDHLHELAQRAAWWSPDTHGHLAVVGAGRSGRTTLLRTLALSCSAGRAAGRPGAAVSVHVIDGDDALLDLRALPHVGTIAAGHDTELVARLLRRLLTRARAGAGPGGGSGSGSGTQDDPTILLVDGWSQVIRRAPMRVQSELSDLLTNLLASGPATGVHVAATFDRGFLSSGIGSHFRERLVLALADPTDALLLGLDRPRSTRTVPGRATRVRDRCDLQVALTAPIEPPTGPTGSPTSSTAAFRLAGLPDRVALGRLWSVDEASTDDNRPPWPVGIGEDDTQVGLDLRQRRAALVVGPPGSGRSSALALLAAAQHRPVVLLSGTEALATCWRALGAPAPRWAGRPSEPGVVARLDQLVAEDPDTVVVVDDLDQPSGSGGGWGAATGAAEVGADAEALLLGWLGTNNAISPNGANNPQGTQSTVLAAATTAATASAYRGLLAELRRHRTGLVLAPSGVLDHEVFGVPVPTVGSARPGRGVVVESSRVTPVQLAHPDGRSPD